MADAKPGASKKLPRAALFRRVIRAERQQAFQPAADDGGEGEAWVIAYVDVITLLLALFVLLLSFATFNESKYNEIAQSLSSVVRGGVPLVRMPVAIDEPPRPEGGIRAADAEEVARRLGQRIQDQGLAHLVLVEADGDKVRMQIRDDVLFAIGSADLSEKGGQLLDALAPTLTEGKYWISVEGHTDNVPIATDRFPSNWELSSARASNVVRRLAGQGIAEDKLRAVGLADTVPLGDNATDEGRARNRRVNLILLGGDKRPF